jgi:hypothetical protein
VHYVLLWTIASRLLIAHWEPESAGSLVTTLDLLIAVLITRLVAPRKP